MKHLGHGSARPSSRCARWPEGDESREGHVAAASRVAPWEAKAVRDGRGGGDSRARRVAFSSGCSAAAPGLGEGPAARLGGRGPARAPRLVSP